MKHHWWTTPVWEIETGFDKTFNSELLQEISLYTQNSEQAINIWNCKSPRIVSIKENILKSVKEYSSEYFSKNNNFDPILPQGWVHKQHPGESMFLHDHTWSQDIQSGVIIVCVYYINAPPESGDLLLVDPRGSTNWDSTQEKYQRIMPGSSKLVIFPAYVMHMVEINKSQETRISLGCNVSPATL